MELGGSAARLGCAVAVCGVLLAGCTSGGDGPDGPATGTENGGAAGTGPSPTAAVDADPARLPRTRAEAAALVRGIMPGPSAFGPGTVRREPYESDPRRWAVLGDSCVWEQRALPEDVLASLTRHYEIPARGGRGPLRLSAVVTAHRSAERADWENAEVLEEMMRCPSQLLRPGEVLRDLTDVPNALGDSGNGFADDVLAESGTYTGDDVGGPHPYVWEQTRIGQFTLAVSARGAKGWTKRGLLDLLREPHATMRTSLRGAIERRTATGSPPPPATASNAPRTTGSTGPEAAGTARLEAAGAAGPETSGSTASEHPGPAAPEGGRR
ncbi:hypothetical protein [Streptomyces rubradiris]|uniref:Lipoprotein n=1 Tax=Streptomyces rubradiris TaxID=285531 RepID=A0ABQ3RBF4_STRRR|nr:hypothetical protein [Streptomyces rubradiris]GHH27833.1 hypothetical protein GCM10018792_70700 [Streptomyces rubradiris]GHI53183.1 hypothetical protein Srubr_30290 [Streptomyces rubradiris]